MFSLTKDANPIQKLKDGNFLESNSMLLGAKNEDVHITHKIQKREVCKFEIKV
jgi:hypothetical protein